MYGLEGEAAQSKLPVDVCDRGRPSAQFARDRALYFPPKTTQIKPLRFGLGCFLWCLVLTKIVLYIQKHIDNLKNLRYNDFAKPTEYLGKGYFCLYGDFIPFLRIFNSSLIKMQIPIEDSVD